MASTSIVEELEKDFARCRDMDASLAERPSSFADIVRAKAPQFAEGVDRLVSRLKLPTNKTSLCPRRGTRCPVQHRDELRPVRLS